MLLLCGHPNGRIPKTGLASVNNKVNLWEYCQRFRIDEDKAAYVILILNF